MNDGSALLAAVYANPDEDTPRLAYADWLDEHGDPDRAEFIRLEIEIATQDDNRSDEFRQLEARRTELLGNHHAAWTSDLGHFDHEKVNIDFSRGFPERFEIREGTATDFKIVRRLVNFRRIELEGRLTARIVRELGNLAQLDCLSITCDSFPAAWLELLAPLPCWTYVRIWSANGGFTPAEWEAFQQGRIGKLSRLTTKQRRIAAVRFLAGVIRRGAHPGHPMKWADLSQMGVTDSELRLVSHADELESISIVEGEETVAGLRHLARLPNLKSVDIGRANVQTIAPLTRCATLEHLGYAPEVGREMGDKGVVGLERLTNLRHLMLIGGWSGAHFGKATFQRLGALRKLESLELHRVASRAEADMSSLARLTKLESLTLEGSVQDHDLQHLSGLTNLTYLSLEGNVLTDASLQHLSALKKLRTANLRSGDSPLTQEGARKLAAQLPAVTIILDQHVVKSPRTSITFRRRIVDGFASALFPTHWTNRSYGEASVMEDGWEGCSFGNDFVSRGEMSLYPAASEPSDSSLAEMEAILQHNAHLDPRILERDVVRLAGKDTASCVFRNCFGQCFVCVIASGGKSVVLKCEAAPARFEEFRPLFVYVAKSLRVGKAAAKGVGEEIEESLPL